MKVVYLAGKYRDSRGPWYVEQNIILARTVAVELWQMGFAVICPHSNTAFFEGPLEDNVILAGDKEMVRRCDALVLLPNWLTSVGAKEEWLTAYESRLPIFYWDHIRDKLSLREWAVDNYDIDRHVRHRRTLENPEMLKNLPVIVLVQGSDDV